MFLRILIIILLFLTANASAEEQATFDILEYQVEGNTVLTKAKIEDAIYPHMGEKKTIDDVEKARASLEKAFHDAGYLTVFVNIPEQKVDGGLVLLNVLEGKVDKLRVVGSRYYSLGEIKDRVSEFAEGSVPNFPSVQKQLASVNNSADRKVAPVLRPGKTPGKVEVDLKVQDEFPFHGGIELNNKYSANTTETRLSGSVRYTNLWQKDHSLGISFQVSPQNTNEVKVISATYVIPRLNGDYFAAYGVISKSNVSAVGDISVVGNGVIAGMRYIRPLPSLTGFSHTVTAGIDYKDFKDSTVLLGADSVNAPISYTPLSLGYDANLVGESSNSQLNLGLTFSLRGFGNHEDQFANKRYLAKSDFAYLRIGAKHMQQLYKQWQISARITGQVANGPLISSEQFGVGGADSVRGYYESNSLGDKGVYGSLELRTPSFAKYVTADIADFYALAFYDTGYTSILDALPQQTASFHLESTGVGLYLKNWKGFFTTLDFARAMHDAGFVKNGDTRLLFRIGYDW